MMSKYTAYLNKLEDKNIPTAFVERVLKHVEKYNKRYTFQNLIKVSAGKKVYETITFPDDYLALILEKEMVYPNDYFNLIFEEQSLGETLFLVDPVTGKPAFRWQKIGTTDKNLLGERLVKNPFSHVGHTESKTTIPNTMEDGFCKEFGIDIDMKNGHDGEASMLKIYARAKELMKSDKMRDTFESSKQQGTKSKGRHILLLDTHDMGIKQGSNIWDGIDFRTAGNGFMRCFPSPGYHKINDGPRLKIPSYFQMLVEERLEEKKEEDREKKRREDKVYAIKISQGVPEGKARLDSTEKFTTGDGRNNRLLSHIGKFRFLNPDANLDELYEEAYRWKNELCEDNWDNADTKIIAIVDYVYSQTPYEKEENMKDPNELLDDVVKELAENKEPKRSGLIRPIHKIEIPMTWVIPGLIPLRELTVVAGDSDVGKSFMLMALAAMTTYKGLHHVFPGSDIKTPRKVYYFSREDDEDSTMLRRFKLNGYEPETEMITVLDKQTSFSDVSKLIPDIYYDKPAFIIYDTASMFLSKNVEMNDQKSTVQDLENLLPIARKFDLAVIVICHLRKSPGEMKERILGSIGFTSLARSVVGVKFKDDKYRIMANVKSNLTDEKIGHEFYIENGVVKFNITGDDYKAEMSKESDVKNVKTKILHWLNEWLPFQSPIITSKDFNDAANAHGFNARLTSEVAKEKLGVLPFKSSEKDKGVKAGIWCKRNIQHLEGGGSDY